MEVGDMEEELIALNAIFIKPDEMDPLEMRLPTRSGRRSVEMTTRVKRYVYPGSVQAPENNVFMQCLSNEGAPGIIKGQEEHYYIHLNPYRPETKHIIDELSPLLKNPSHFEVGAMYTFVLASLGVRQQQSTRDHFPVFTPCTEIALYATKVNNIFEHGTKHHQIFYRITQMEEEQALIASCAQTHMKSGKKGNPCYALFASGEIHCVGEHELRFNFFSGTFKMFQHVSSKPSVAHNETVFMTHMINTIAPTYGIGRLDRPFITSETRPVTEIELQRLRDRGILIIPFKTLRECRNFNLELRSKKAKIERESGRKNIWFNEQEVTEIYEKMNQRMASTAALPPVSDWMAIVRSYNPFSKQGGRRRKRTLQKKKGKTLKKKKGKTLKKRPAFYGGMFHPDPNYDFEVDPGYESGESTPRASHSDLKALLPFKTRVNKLRVQFRDRIESGELIQGTPAYYDAENAYKEAYEAYEAEIQRLESLHGR